MWTELIGALPGETVVMPAASEASIQACQQELGHPLPEELVSFLRESNGLQGEDGLGLVWPVERIAADNRAFRTDVAFARLYMPFDALLFFGDAGNGDQFAVVPHTGRTDVFAWDHENDGRTWVAPALASTSTGG
ncbi:SMI1/KNR4 family protein [Streptacidiphilus sp. PAMC 29251]